MDDGEHQSNHDTSPSSSSEPQRKRRRTTITTSSSTTEQQNDAAELNTNSTTLTTSFKRQNENGYTKRWRTERDQQIYSSKLIQALQHVRKGNNISRIGRGREVRRTADRVLAVSAKGATRWSRAVLENSLSLRLNRRRRKTKVAAVVAGKKRKLPPCAAATRKKKLPAVEKRLRVLGKLIPGCRKASKLNLLEEATDYIAALEMQVRVMTAIAEIMASAPPPSTVDSVES